MWKSFKVKVEPLTSEAFAPFGEVIETFEEAKPEIAKGGLRSAAYPVTADLAEATADAELEKTPLSEGLQRAHFAFHTDAGSSVLSKPAPPNRFSGRSYQGYLGA